MSKPTITYDIAICTMEKLISEVQKRNILWNKINPQSKDRIAVNNEWNAIAQKTGLPKDDAKRKWRNLRDQFLKEFKKVKKSKTSETNNEFIYTGKWLHFPHLLFLKDSIMAKDLENNYSFAGSIQEEGLTKTSEIDEEEDVESAGASNAESDDERTTESRVRPKKRKRHCVRTFQERLLDIKSKQLALMERQDDENVLFLKSLTPYFKKMNYLQQLRVRKRFHEILIEELSEGVPNLGNNSCPSSSPIDIKYMNV